MTADTIDLTSLQDEIDSLAAQITKQGGEVRTLKKNSSSDADAIGEAVKALQILKIGHKELLVKMEGASGGKDTFNRQIFDELILRKMFVVPSFEIHGGVKGLFDLGPPACALKVRKDLERYRYSRDLFYIDMFTHFANIIYLQGGNA
jgi:glycyl-tRNA synthetase